MSEYMQNLRASRALGKPYIYFFTLKPYWFLLDRPKQGTLDGIITRQPCQPAFTTDGLLDYIIELVISEDKVITITNSSLFVLILSDH